MNGLQSPPVPHCWQVTLPTSRPMTGSFASGRPAPSPYDLTRPLSSGKASMPTCWEERHSKCHFLGLQLPSGWSERSSARCRSPARRVRLSFCRTPHTSTSGLPTASAGQPIFRSLETSPGPNGYWLNPPGQNERGVPSRSGVYPHPSIASRQCGLDSVGLPGCRYRVCVAVRSRRFEARACHFPSFPAAFAAARSMRRTWSGGGVEPPCDFAKPDFIRPTSATVGGRGFAAGCLFIVNVR